MQYEGPNRSRSRSRARLPPWLILALPLIAAAAFLGARYFLVEHQARRAAASAAAVMERLSEGAEERARASAAEWAAVRIRSTRALGYMRGPAGARLVIDSDPGNLPAATEHLCGLARGLTRDSLRDEELEIVIGARGLPTSALGRIRCR